MLVDRAEACRRDARGSNQGRPLDRGALGPSLTSRAKAKGSFTVKITGKLTNGKPYSQTRKYHTCFKNPNNK